LATIITALFWESIPRSKGLTNFTTREQIANSNRFLFNRRKKLSKFGNRSHDQHVGPAPYGGGLQFLLVLLDWVANMIR